MKKKLMTHQQRRQRRETQEYWCVTLGALIFPILLILTAWLTRYR